MTPVGGSVTCCLVIYKGKILTGRVSKEEGEGEEAESMETPPHTTLPNNPTHSFPRR
jgi:hypothetical protein